jgi:DNA-directed RNA polymerase specialized sigma24 family protein
VLQGKLVLHDLRDTEALAMRIVERSGFVLSYAEREELATYLIEVAWEISTVWRPGAASFSTYATTTLRRRAIDWKRQKSGRTTWRFKDRVHIRELPQLVSLDADEAERDRLEQTLAADGGDSAADRDETRRRLDGERDQHRTRDLAELDASAPEPRSG